MDNKYLKSFIDYLIGIRAIDSVKDFAERSDINRQYIYRMLEGKVKISHKTVAKIRATFTDEFIDYNTRNNHLIDPDQEHTYIAEGIKRYGACKDCSTKEEIIEQQKATIAALQETLSLYRKAEQERAAKQQN